MDKKTIAIILAVLLIVAFFLPYVVVKEADISISGYKAIFGKGGLFGTKGVTIYLILLVPIGAIVALISAVSDDTNNSYGTWMPLVGIIYLTIMMYVEMNKGARIAGGASIPISTYIGVLGVGYWITLVASVLLPINNSRKV